MIQAIPKGLFSGGFQLQRDDRFVAELNASSWREKADVVIEGAAYQLYREGMLSGAFVLDREGERVARAHKVSVFTDTFELQIGKRSFTLRKESIWSRRFGLYEGDERIGGITPAGVFTRRALIELPADWPASIQTFIFWLVLLMWKRAEVSAAS